MVTAQRFIHVADLHDQAEAAVLHQHLHEVTRFAGEVFTDSTDDHALQLGGPDIRSVNQCGNLRVGYDSVDQFKRIGPCGQRILLAGELECCFSVGSGDGDGFGHIGIRAVSARRQSGRREPWRQLRV